ncbi:MAG: cation:proton antiporter [Hyphomonadaceae bacterium]|nr:cation:proton antiporter [Hyphomonadaceae bacterium]
MIGWIGACLASAIALVAGARLFIGPTLHDRALAALGVAIHTALACAALGLAIGAPHFVDVAFALLIGALVVSAAVLKFFRARSFQPALAPGAEE